MRISDWSSDVCSSDLIRLRDYGTAPCDALSCMLCICASNTLFGAQILSTASQYGSACTRAVCSLAHQPCDANSIVRLGLGVALVAPPQSDLFRDSAGISQFLERPPRGHRRDRQLGSASWRDRVCQ